MIKKESKSWGFFIFGVCSFISLGLILFQQDSLILLNDEGDRSNLVSEVMVFIFCLIFSFIGWIGMKFKNRLLVMISTVAMLICTGYLSVATIAIGWNIFHLYFAILIIYGLYILLSSDVQAYFESM